MQFVAVQFRNRIAQICGCVDFSAIPNGIQLTSQCTLEIEKAI